MKFLFFSILLFLFSCTKNETQNQINFEITAINLGEKAFYNAFVNEEKYDSLKLDINGQARNWYGYRNSGSTYKVEIFRNSIYDTGWVKIVWHNGSKEVLHNIFIYADTLTTKIESSIVK